MSTIINKNFSIINKVQFSLNNEIVSFAEANSQAQDIVTNFPYKSQYVRSYPQHRQKYSTWLRQNHPDSFKSRSQDPKFMKVADQAMSKDVKTVAQLATKVAKSNDPEGAKSKLGKILTSKGAKILYGLTAGAALAAVGAYVASPSIQKAAGKVVGSLKKDGVGKAISKIGGRGNKFLKDKQYRKEIANDISSDITKKVDKVGEGIKSGYKALKDYKDKKLKDYKTNRENKKIEKRANTEEFKRKERETRAKTIAADKKRREERAAAENADRKRSESLNRPRRGIITS